MKLKIIVDDATGDTRVVADNGEVIEGVQSVEWSIDNNSRGESECIVRLKGVPIDLMYHDFEAAIGALLQAEGEDER